MPSMVSAGVLMLTNSSDETLRVILFHISFCVFNGKEDPEGAKMVIDYFRLLGPQGEKSLVN